MDVLAFWVLVAGKLWLDAESVGTKVVTLGLEKVCWEVLSPVTVKEGKGGGEARGWDSPEGTLGNDVSPTWLGVVNSLVEEVVEQQVLELWVAAVGVGNVLQEDGADDATTTPHEGDLWLVQLPAVLTGGL